MSKRRAGQTVAIIVGLLMAGIPSPVGGGEENAAVARVEAMANLLAVGGNLELAGTLCGAHAEFLEFFSEVFAGAGSIP